MFALLTALVSLPYLFAQAAPAATASTLYTLTGTSVASNLQCSTEYGSTAPTPLPTSTTTIHDQTTTISESTITSQVVTVVTAAPTPYTVTSFTTVFIPTTITQGVYTTEIFVYDTETIGTFSSTSLICTDGASPTSTATVYTGNYTLSSGPPTTTPTSYPTSVDCTNDLTTFYSIYPYTVSGTTTYTYTPASTVATTTSTTTRTTYTYIPYSSTTTITSGGTFYTAATTILTASISCAATTTTTYAAKCAPSNLIGSVNGNGIFVIDNSPGTANVLVPNAAAGQDPSQCCQLCQDNAGCAAEFASPEAGNCNLVFSNTTIPAGTYTNSTSGTCGQAFSYGDNGNTGGANSAFIVQSGCGSISPIG